MSNSNHSTDIIHDVYRPYRTKLFTCSQYWQNTISHNSSFPSIHQNSTLISLTCKMLYNRSLPGWLQTFLLSTLLKLSFFLSDLNNSFLKFTTLLSLQPTLLATLALSLMNTLPSLTKSLHFVNPATITFVNFAVSAHISTSKQPAPLPPPLSILNLITVTLSITTFRIINLTVSNRSRTLLLVLLLRLLNPHIFLSYSQISPLA